MSGEVMTTSIGLGQTLMTGRNLADIKQVMLVMVVIVVVGILIDQVVFYNVEKSVPKMRGLLFELNQLDMAVARWKINKAYL